MDRRIEYLKKLKENHKPAIKISWLSANEEPMVDFTDELYDISGSYNVNMQDGARRTCTITIDNRGNKFPINYNGIWIGQKFQLWTGLYLDDGTPYYISQGIYCVINPQEDYSPDKRTITIQGVDKWAYLDGSLFGNLTGTYKTVPGQDVRDLIRGILRYNRYANDFAQTGDIMKMIDPKEPSFVNYNSSDTTQVLQRTIDTGVVVYTYNDGTSNINIGADTRSSVGWYLISFGTTAGQHTIDTSTEKDPGSATLTPLIETQSRYLTPYTVAIASDKTLADVVLEYNTMLMGKCYYDRDGYLTFTPIRLDIDDISNSDKKIGWNFTITEQELLSLQTESKFKEVFNDIIVLGSVTNGKQASARVQNRDPSNDCNVDKIGLKTKTPYTSDQYTTDTQCEELAKYYAQTDMALDRSGTITSMPIYHLDVDQIVTVATEHNYLNPDQYLITAISANLSGTMTLTVSNLRYFVNWTVVPKEEVNE